jgi:hypothetical protein
VRHCWCIPSHPAHTFPFDDRFTDSQQVYVVQNGVLRGIPNLHTFIAMGFDFDNVKVLYASDRPGYSIGDMLPGQ